MQRQTALDVRGRLFSADRSEAKTAGAFAHKLKERSFSIDNAETFFLYNYEIKDMLLIIYQAGLQASVYDAFYAIMVSEHGDNPEERYRNRFYSYGLFGLLDEWIKRRFSESPDEMAKTLRRIVT